MKRWPPPGTMNRRLLGMSKAMIFALTGGTSCFFFQAEAGIRCGTVTGVQTCALPILFYCLVVEQAVDRLGVRLRVARVHLAPEADAPVGDDKGEGDIGDDRRQRHEREGPVVEPPRSEERRVGKEWKSWWTAKYLNKQV